MQLSLVVFAITFAHIDRSGHEDRPSDVDSCRLTSVSHHQPPATHFSSIKSTKSLLAHQLRHTIRMLKRHDQGKLTGICFRDLTCSELLGKFISELGFPVGDLVSNVDFETSIALVADVVPTDEICAVLNRC
jgi:hypothetical protein